MVVEPRGITSKNLKPVHAGVLPMDISFEKVVWQNTIAVPISCTGIGVHSGKPVQLTLRPALADSGYVFIRTDVPTHSRRIVARWDTVSDTAMCTTITNAKGISVSTIEHVIAALAGCGVHNVIIEIDGPEVPIMDGSSVEFVNLIEHASLRRQRKILRPIKVLKTIEVNFKNSSALLKPQDEAEFIMHFNANGRLGDESWSLTYYPNQDSFSDLLAKARTFGFYEDAQFLWSKGLAQGSSLNNTVVIKEGKIMNEEGLRFKDEFVRHKMLDAIGDFALAGGPIIGQFVGLNSGHALNNQLLRALFADETAWTFL